MAVVGLPAIFKPLIEPKRYKIYYGGRGSAKSVSFARVLLLKGAQCPIRVLCTREIQKSINDSVHRLLSDQIKTLGLDSLYEVQNQYIKGSNGTIFMFEGLRSNISKIKSLAGINYCWVEEGEGITAESWDILIPTIREEGSEIWVSFNPLRDDDETYRRFVSSPPSDSIVQEVTWRDNPYFPEVLKKEMEECKKLNHTKYLHIWEGKPITNYDSLVYLWRDDVNESKTELKYNQMLETYVSWDFGVRDDTAIIWWQVEKVPKSEYCQLGYRITIIDEYSNHDKTPDHYRAIVNSKPYRVSMHYCDPAGANRESDLRSWVDRLGFNFDWTHQYSIAEMVDRSNELMPSVLVNRVQCPKVWKMFRSWQWKTDKDGRLVLPPKPVHDEFSHFGTSFYYGIINRFPTKKKGGQVYVY